MNAIRHSLKSLFFNLICIYFPFIIWKLILFIHILTYNHIPIIFVLYYFFTILFQDRFS